jgi:eukaryotic-like serine/threonine-protein kinase
MTLKIDPLQVYASIGLLFHNRYLLKAQLGIGGAGNVYRALDIRLDRLVAIKIFVTEGRGIDWSDRFRSEAVTIARLSHSGVVRIYDFDETDGLFYLALELIPGRDLWALLAEHEDILPLATSVRICRNILDSLDYIHRQGVIHCDLKPENVMVVDEQFHICLTDFGVASNSRAKQTISEGIIAGSAYYLAPEVIDGQRADERSDLYALGVMLYELSTGRLPFYDESPVEVMLQHRDNPPLLATRLNTEIPTALESIIMKLLAKYPDERFQSAAEARTALNQVIFFHSPTARQTGQRGQSS